MEHLYYITKTLGTGAGETPFYCALNDYGEAHGIDGRPDPTQQAGRWLGRLVADAAGHAAAQGDGNVLMPFWANGDGTGYLSLDALVSHTHNTYKSKMRDWFEPHGIPVDPVQGSWTIREALAYIARIKLFRQWMKGQGIPAIVEGLDYSFSQLSVARRSAIKEWLNAKGFDPKAYNWTGATKIRKALVDMAQDLIHPELTRRQDGRWEIPILGWVSVKSTGRRKASKQYADDFNRTDSATLGLSWAEAIGAAGMEIKSNEVKFTGGPTAGTNEMYSRWDQGLDTVDHLAQIKVTLTDVNLDTGCVVRCDTNDGSPTQYLGDCAHPVGDVKYRLFKRVSGTFTSLSSSAEAAPSAPYIIKTKIEGTTLKVFKDDVEKDSVTDSAISTGTRAGFRFHHGVTDGQISTADDFLTQDLGYGAGAPTTPEALGLHALRGLH